MTTPTSLPTRPARGTGLTTERLWHSSFRSMASPVRVQLGLDTPDPVSRHDDIRALFDEVARQCTRFEPTSDLMRANAAGDAWQRVGGHCFAALQAAFDAHRSTGALFDPRVLRALSGLGYSTTLPFADGVGLDGTAAPARPLSTPWAPQFDAARRAVRVGPEPVDLGGIGKGLALRWAGELLDASGTATFLIDAGGDCVARGAGPAGEGWNVGVEDPTGTGNPVAVLTVFDGACATSSTRLLSWAIGGERVHHLIDPRTGRPGGGDLRSVTVVAGDPADAEVWSKVLFLHGDRIASVAEELSIAAVWVRADGTHGLSSGALAHVVWQRR